MSTETSTLTSPGDPLSSPTAIHHDYPDISPALQHLWRSPKSASSYGCVREVYHPLSSLAEPSAVLFYDSDDDEEGESSAAESSSAKPKKPDTLKPQVDDASPLARRKINGTAQPPSSRSGNSARLQPGDIPSSFHRRMSDPKSPDPSFNASRKRGSQPNVSELFGIPLGALHISGDTEEERPKRSKNDVFSPRKLHYGDEHEASGDAPADPEEVVSSSPGDVQGPSTPARNKGKEPEAQREAPKKLQESPTLVSGSPKQLPKYAQRTPVWNSGTRLPTTSPRRLPLPPSPEGSPPGSVESSPIMSLSASPMRNLSPSMNRHGSGKGRAAADAEAIAQKLEILHIKAQEYSESVTRPASDRKLARELDALFSKENRFDPKEAAMLEERYQRKIRIVYERRLAEEMRQAELERQEQERIRAVEAARKAEEERKRREEEESRRREQELQERKWRELNAARERAEQEKKEAEARRLAEENARKEQDARAKAAKDARDQADAAALVLATAAKVASDAARAQAAQPSNAPQVYGRRSFETETANVKRVIANLKELGGLDEAFLKGSGLWQMRRGLIPKFGQLNGMREQTLQVREAIKAALSQVLTFNTPLVPASKFLFQPLDQEIQVPVGFVWVVNQLAKMASRQLLQECQAKSEAADPIGVVIAAIFADPKFSPGGKSFIDIFVARFLKRNPILCGADGPDDTDADRERLGWKKDVLGATESEDSYSARMQAYTAGFVAISARDFARSSMHNPYPAFNLWHVLSGLLNKPVDKLTNSHYFVVNTIIFSGARKLCSIYGRQAKKMIEIAIGPFAAQGMQRRYQGAQAIQATGIYFQKQEWWNAL